MKINELTFILKGYEDRVLGSLSAYLDAHRFVRRNQLQRYLLVSGIAFLALFTLTIRALVAGVAHLETATTAWAMPWLQQLLTLRPEDVQQGIRATFWLAQKAIENNQYAIFSAIFLIIGTPYFSFISAKTEEIHSGNVYPFSFRAFLHDIKRGLSVSIRNSLWQSALILLITLLALVPLIGIVAPLLTFGVQAYFNGIVLTDYTLERRGYAVHETSAFNRAHKPEMFALGLGFMFLLSIPVVGWFVAPTYGLVASYLCFSQQQPNAK